MSRGLASASAAAALLAIHAAVNARLLRRPKPVCERSSTVTVAERSHTGLVSVLVPARDEARRIGQCVAGVLASEGVGELELLVLDDESADGTAETARAAAGGDRRLRVLTGRPLPPGWLGKPHACAQLTEAASGDVLVFLDADVRLAPSGLAATVALLQQGPLNLVSPYPHQLADGIGPRLVQPLLQWSWLTFLPLRLAERSPRPSLVAANGQLMACTATAYRHAGGHAGVRDAVIEDVALARAFKLAGLRAGVADGTQVAACRMYSSWAELSAGYTKSLWAAFGSPPAAVAVAAMLAALYLWPPLAAVRALACGDERRAVVGLLGWAAGLSGRVVTAWRTGGAPRDAFAHPASVTVLLWLLARSWLHKATGRLEWKGRAVG